MTIGELKNILEDLKLRIDNGYADLFLEVKDGNYIHFKF